MLYPCLVLIKLVACCVALQLRCIFKHFFCKCTPIT